MDPLSTLLYSINQAASTRSPSAQDVLTQASTTIAQSEQVAPQRTLSAPSELAQLTTCHRSRQWRLTAVISIRSVIVHCVCVHTSLRLTKQNPHSPSFQCVHLDSTTTSSIIHSTSIKHSTFLKADTVSIDTHVPFSVKTWVKAWFNFFKTWFEKR